jgi:hypothetical protein
MEAVCPECGARLEAGETCRSTFDEFMALEMTDPEYGQVHFLTVACYMIQHNQYSDRALVWIEPKLKAFLEQNLSNQQIRAVARLDTDSGQRKWKVLRQPGDHPLPKILWSQTIMDVARRYTDPQSYRELVRSWGRSVLQDGLPLFEIARK